MRNILSLILAVIMALSAGTAGVSDIAPVSETASLAGVNWSDLEYEHIDPAAFYEQVDRLNTLAEEDDADAVLTLFDDLYAQVMRMSTMDSISYIKYSAAVTDEYWTQENLYNDEMLTEAADAFCQAAYSVLQGPCADALAEHVGADAAEYYAEYEPLTDRESELLVQESDLVDQYFEAMAAEDEVEYEYDGRTWTFEMINGSAGDALSAVDFEGYREVYFGLQKALNDQVGPIFTQLVAIRDEIADIRNYDSYADLAYEQDFGRDYTCEEAQVFCDAVKEVAPYYYAFLYYSDLWYDRDVIEPVMDAEELLDTFGRFAAQLDEITVEPLEYMIDHGMYDIAAGDDRMVGAYTMNISELGSPFLFMGLDGTYYDMSSLSHEFGHFINGYYSPSPDPMTATSNYDLSEIHSTGLETLFTAYYDQIYTEGADIAKFCVLGEMVESVIDGCIHDEFQRRIYDQPDMTLDEINRLYASICVEYGQYELTEEDYTWMYINHDFERPMYYISYAAAAMATIQIWNIAQEDFQAGVDTWKAILEAGSYEDGYMTVLPACGLRLFTEEGAVEEVLEPLMDEMLRLDAAS